MMKRNDFKRLSATALVLLGIGCLGGVQYLGHTTGNLIISLLVSPVLAFGLGVISGRLLQKTWPFYALIGVVVTVFLYTMLPLL